MTSQSKMTFVLNFIDYTDDAAGPMFAISGESFNYETFHTAVKNVFLGQIPAQLDVKKLFETKECEELFLRIESCATFA